MGSFSNFPNLVAGGNISPNRLITLSTSADNTGVSASGNTVVIIGVTDSSTKAFDSTLHAESGDPISLQPGMVCEVEAGGVLTAGQLVTANASGKAVSLPPNGYAQTGWITLQAASGDGAIIRICPSMTTKHFVA